ncbi:MAG: class I tRNA ligase family protein [Acidobacteriota bacterium]|nr:class I tRNA ligase family protein [Acidobacteriota bacterium]
MSKQSQYIPSQIESKCHEVWRHAKVFEAPPPSPGRKDTYVYACTPFTTGKAHMGHVRSYTIADVCARRARSEGDAVLWAMGFDAFGLPNEIAAIEHSIPPREWVRTCREKMVEQFERLGLSVDWSRCFVTSDPEYYRWTQWVFLRFRERGLVYRAEGIENWCDTCRAVLASLQVSDDGRCWRCGCEVRLSCIQQWYLRLLPYADELERGLAGLTGWDEPVLACQRTLLGKTEGVELEVPLPSGPPLTVFTLYPEAISGAAFIALSPNHPYVERLIPKSRVTLDLETQRRRSLSREQRSTNSIPVIKTDHVLRVWGLGRDLPVVITPLVDFRFGGGAALGIPSHDRDDATLAAQLRLATIEQPAESETRSKADTASRYRLRDNSISRQRSWGAPIPIIHCATCGQVPVPDEDLPVLLPDDLVPTGEGSPLANHPTFAACACPSCGRPARRDTDTLDVHVDSIWMLVPFCVPPAAQAEQMFTHPDLQRWLPVEQVVCGADQAGWWMNDRLFFKVMRDCGYFSELSAGEPVRNLLMHEMVLSGGRKMSKSLGNAVDPDEVIKQYGADAVRLTVLKVNPRKAFNWTEESLQENHRFLSELWDFALEILDAPVATPTRGVTAQKEALRRKLVRWRDTAVHKVQRAFDRRDFHVVLKELKNFFGMIRRFDAQSSRIGPLQADDLEVARAAVLTLLQMLEPLAPHISHELSERLATQAAGARESYADTLSESVLAVLTEGELVEQDHTGGTQASAL